MINKDMTIMEALEQNRASATVFAGYGMGCIGCLAASAKQSPKPPPTMA